MSNTPSPFETLNNIRKCNTEAVIWQTRSKNQALTNFLRETLSSSDVEQGALMGQPVIEAAYPFIEASQSFGDLSGNVLNPKLVSALAGDDDIDNENYRFDRQRHPYKHQIEAWHSLSQKEPRSVIVSSGTGSGKTECFMVPLLNDLAIQAESNAAISGVQAIIIYPLNALIESQKERLQKWTKPFNGAIRFALYNGMTQESANCKNKRRAHISSKEQVFYRDEIRENPPPILVTNITMLEYMLLRKKDNSIIQKSNNLKWIILDEAHTHIGSSAAELTLLIRRVLETFGKTPDEVRFVATSATIGSGDDNTKKNQLTNFMKAITGQSEDKIDVILGHREFPKLPPIVEQNTTVNISTNDAPEELYDILASNMCVQNLISRLKDPKAGTVSFTDFRKTAKLLNPGLDEGEFAIALSRAKKNGVSLAPLRIHAFHRVLPGIWSCINENCTEKHKGWRFGKLLHKQSEECPCCSSPVLEVLYCHNCGEPALIGEKNGRFISQCNNVVISNEYAKTIDIEDDLNEENIADKNDGNSFKDESVEYYLYPEKRCEGGIAHNLNDDNIFIDDNEAKIKLQAFKIKPNKSFKCPSCQNKAKKSAGNIMEDFSFQAPFLLLSTNPKLLEGTPEQTDVKNIDEGENISINPGKGRQLLSFTDSRQGTARLSAKFEKDNQRNFVRSFIYNTVQSVGSNNCENLSEIEEEIAKLKKAKENNPELRDFFDKKIQEEILKLTPTVKSIGYDELKTKLANDPMVSDWIHRKIWHSRDFEVFNSVNKTADFLLKREIYRRSRFANTIETLGLASIKYPVIDKLWAPDYAKANGIDDNEWRNFLYVIINFWIRSNVIIDFDKSMLRWIDNRQYPKWIIPPEANEQSAYEYKITPFGKNKVPNLPTKLLFAALNWDLDSESDRNKSLEIYRLVWDALNSFLRNGSKYNLQFNKSELIKIDKAYICPVTHRIIDNVFMGYSPYSASELLKASDKELLKAKEVIFPNHINPFPNNKEEDDKVEHWIKTEENIAKLRKIGLWGNLQDRYARAPIYYRSVEHSAQIDRQILEEYEKEFKANQINILNCSTTMEMGVDIGSVSTVMMNNLPPSIANYRQRVGRAGRRGQNLAAAFTICKDRPLDQMAFKDPIKFLHRELPVPKVELNSKPIVQRHINSWALADFIRNKMSDKSGISLDCKTFFGYNSDGQKEFATVSKEQLKGIDTRSDCNKFIEYIQSQEFEEANTKNIQSIIKGSVLANYDLHILIEGIVESISNINKLFCERVDTLFSVISEFNNGRKGKGALFYQIRRITGEFLLKYLVEKGFLPGHGFPRDVVDFNFNTANMASKSNASQDGYNYNDFPKRQLDIALREYAPGANVVVNGLVYKSSGISLNWKRPSKDTLENDIKEIQDLKYFWACPECGAIGTNYIEGCKCGSAVTIYRALKPAGFIASFDENERAHDNVDDISSLKAEPMKISLAKEIWQGLTADGMGKFRSSIDADAYYANKGVNEEGFAICLECGRAKAHDSSKLNPLKDHTRIDFHSGKTIKCKGNYDNKYAIQENVILLYNYTTEAFELQFNSKVSETGARAFGSALREAFTNKIGVEVDELGISVDTLRGNVSLYLFDKASGGAGYASQIPSYFDELMPIVENILYCDAKCKDGCVNCVVNKDVGSKDTPVNRHEALDWVEKYIESIGNVELDDDIGDNPKKIANAVMEIDRIISNSRNASITLFISPSKSDDCIDWLAEGKLSKVEISKILEKWSHWGASINISIDNYILEGLEVDEIMQINKFQGKTKVNIGISKNSRIGQHFVIATVQSDNVSHLILSRDETFKYCGEDYGTNNDENGILISTSGELETGFKHFDIIKLLKSRTIYKLIDIDDRFNSDFLKFGKSFSQEIYDGLTSINAIGKGKVKYINYSDRYCTSPQSIRLFLETIRWLLKLLGSNDKVKVYLEIRNLYDNDKKKPWAWGHDWEESKYIKSITDDLCAKYNIDLHIREQENIMHRRTMTIFYEDDTESRITLDMGFGYWHIETYNNYKQKFPFDSIKDSITAFNKNYKIINNIGTSYIALQKIDNTNKIMKQNN